MAMEVGKNYANYGNQTNITASAANRTGKATAGQTNIVATAADAAASRTVRVAENEKTEEKKAEEYYDYLQEKYSCVKDGNVVISGAYLKECAGNPQKAKELEENLAFYKKSREGGYRSALANAGALGARVASYSESWSIDHTGNVTMVSNTTVTSGDAAEKKKQKEESESETAGRAMDETDGKTQKILSGEAKQPRKTAADEIAYLAKKYKNCSFAAVNFKPGMRQGTLETTNIAISPDFLKKMANNPALEQEYESYFEDMQRLDAENISSHAAQGRRIVAQGWAIDRNGGISRWGISEPTNKRNYGQAMTDYANKIREANAEKKKESKNLPKRKNP